MVASPFGSPRIARIKGRREAAGEGDGFQAIRDQGRPLSTRLMEELFQIVKQTQAGIRRTPGTKLANAAGEIVYTPPEGERLLRDKLANLEAFLHAEDGLDPLVKMAVAHYQFEAIHPFTDGNGRVGRIFNILFLIEQGLLELPALYLSRYILERKNDYYLGLRGVTERGDWEGWLLYMLEGIARMAALTRDKIFAIRKLFEASADKVRREAPAIYSKDLLEVVFRHPYCKIRFLEEAGLGHRQTASKYLQELERIGLLRGVKIGREKYFINDEFFRVLVD